MGRREDMIAALACRTPAGAVPVWELEFHAWDAASGRHVVLGREFEALSAAGRDRAMHANAEIITAVAAALDFAAVTVPGGYWYQGPGDLAYYVLPGDSRFRQAAILREHAPDELLLVAGSGGVMAADYAVEFCCRMFDEPESIDAQARATLARGVDTARRLRDCGVEIVFTASDLADNSGPFFNGEQMRRWILPNLDAWADAVGAMGLWAILHSDGNLTPYLDAIAATGVDALQSVDPVAGMDLRAAKDVVAGRLCLCGNVDCGLLVRAAPEDVYAATRDLLVTCKDGGGLVLGASNAVQADVPLATYRAMIAAWRDHGQYDR